MFRENYQQNNSFSIDTYASKECKSCGLCCNQSPLIEKKNKADVIWVGLSAVKISPFENTTPLSIRTNTGSIINRIELNIQNATNFYKTNLVKCLPLKIDKIRYPKVSEMEHCFPFLTKEIKILKPRIIFLLGKQVGIFVLKKFGVVDFDLNPNFEYSVFNFENISYVPIHHPSYIFVYKRKIIDEYIKRVSELIDKKTNERSSNFPSFDYLQPGREQYGHMKWFSPILRNDFTKEKVQRINSPI